jgi:hypothetical protein
LVQGRTRGPGNVQLDAGRQIPVHSGYPVGHWNNAMRYVLNRDDIGFTSAGVECSRDWCARGNQRQLPIDSGTLTTSGRITKIFPQGFSYGDRCGVYYVNHEDGRRPDIGLIVSDC